jgi:hypothetical protein
MNWIDILWAILTVVSGILFICGAWASHHKLWLVNYILIVSITIYAVEMMQTITHLSKPGYVFRMLTWVIQASYIAFCVHRVWQKPWLKNGSDRLNGGGSIAIALILMSCLCMLILK